MKLFPMTKPATESITVIPTPMSTAVLPPEPLAVIDPLARRSTGSLDFNILKIVEEHGPLRIQTIDKELEQMLDKMAKLTREKEQLTNLINALEK